MTQTMGWDEAVTSIQRSGGAADFSTRWDAGSGVLTIRLSGRPSLDEVQRWEAGLYAVLDEIPRDASLRVLADLSGYDVSDVPWEIHRRQREVIPRFLLRLGHVAGYLSLFQAVPLPLIGTEVRVTAVAHVHHDREKVQLYETALSRPNDRYFSDRTEALRWLVSEAPAVAAAVH